MVCAIGSSNQWSREGCKTPLALAKGRSRQPYRRFPRELKLLLP
jgi:hypothetical protein